jgi:hypothetical protein
MQENGVPWVRDPRDLEEHYMGDYTDIAADHGDLALLQYLHESGYEWSEKTTASAAFGRHYDCLDYLREYGCPIDEYAARVTADYCRSRYVRRDRRYWDGRRGRRNMGNRRM